MKNKTTTYKWAYLPFVFSSAAILATQATAGPTGSQNYQEAKQVNSINHEYVGGTSQIGVGVDDEGNVDAEFNQVISESDNHSTGVGLWAGYDLKGDDKGILGRGGQVNHTWVSRDASGRATHVNKTFAAYDRNEAGHDKATVGYGQENEHLFWDGRVSKGLSGGKDKRTVNGSVVTDRAYDWGVGATVGKFLPNANARIRAGIDHEWSNEVGSGEKNARNTTLSAGIEKFFHGTGHSLSLDVAGSKNSGGFRFEDQDDTDVTGRLGYKYDFGGSSIYQPDRRYRRVRVEVPGQAVAPRYAQKQQYKKVPTYKTVPVYGNKTVRTPYKQLVKSTMELEGQTFFKLNSAKLIPSAQTRLKQIAAQIRKTGYKGSIRITGNTCGLGDARYDQILSEKRAKEVRNFLIKNGFNPNHLIARGLGKGHPKYPRTVDQDFKNRRVDIEYVTQQEMYKTGHKSETKRVQTGTRRVATGFKNVPAGMKNVMISNGRPGAPRVVWKTEAIPTSPAWIKRALHNNIQHDRGVNIYTTTFGNEGPSTPENTGPVAVNDAVKAECGAPVSINVLGNDRDADGDALTITSFTQPANGIVTRGTNGTLIYTPNSSAACGVDDSFDYTISDGNGGTSTATVNVTVDPADVNTAPDAVDDSKSTGFNQATTITVLENDTDPENDLLTVTSFTQGTDGSVTRGANGQLIYAPDNGFVGADSFTYTISDGNGGTDTATVTVTVGELDKNTAPNAVDDSKSTDFNQATTITVLGNDTDPENDPLMVTGFTQSDDGTVTRGTNGQLVYTPDTGFVGTDSFSYTISDGNDGTDTATVTITVGEPDKNTAPNAVDDSKSTDFNKATIITVLGNDTDPENDPLMVTNFTQGATGTVSRGLDGKLIYIPNTGFFGTDSFTYTISDGNGGTDTATVTVKVGEPDKNTNPDAVDDSKSTGFNQQTTITVLGNDTDPENDPLTVTSFTQGTEGGKVIEGSNGELKYTPANGFVGTDTFTYTISDGNGGTDTATVTVIVDKAVNKPPIAMDDSESIVCSTSSITINVLDNDTDPEYDTLDIITVDATGLMYGTAMQSGNQIIYKPFGCGKGETGVDNFSYTISDGNGNTDSANVKVSVEEDVKAVDVIKAKMDDGMVNAGGSVTLNVLLNDSGDGLRITRVDQPTNGKVTNTNSTVTYTPNPDFTHGSEMFKYYIEDENGKTDSALIIIDVTKGCPTGMKCN